ncbi:DUF2637 domain-containing protein [Streptomyces sp. WAC05374]|uniref:DUF2637 domain-containing protein n=1 Tax=Streptomyces sp. WAC05374 TaxID=2487420 RepID=UPI000F86ECA9|nr:DUF2637 domain-containing protein [Streptomyces sp. WAC05374]RST19121.1 DUF2637 domain-containing protein [Streptomyces sp. WAC05374]TDF38110.1 DUF2637 domain-containing protein [Streptomyces sp. WAC05374]TDF53569.1 DUF2637 domain-containing protein [Streptomyces sp. WAC05374]TDF59416.1 DUF2637 domain-containing protein [Streptomyces sp. WAC05374]
MSTTEVINRPAVPPLTKPEMGPAGLGALAAAGVGALGLIASFDAVSAAAAQWGFGEPWMLPVGIDVAIPVFTVANLLLIRMDMALAWVRFVPWALTLVTCGLNVAAGESLWAKVAHGTMPLLWVVFSEIGAHVYAVRIGAATGRRMEKVRFSRWMLAPLSTFALWRRMTLWEITSYSEALKRERDRQLARARLREQHGRRWRTKTPRPERVLLKLGELAPASEDVPPVPPQEAEKPKPEAPKTPRKRPAGTKGKAKTAKGPRTAAELLTEAREATADWSDDAINAEAIRTTLHCSAANSRVLRDLLLNERAEGRRLHSVDDNEGTEGAAA